MNLVVSLTQEQYDRYKAAFAKLQDKAIADITDDMLISQLKREASAITYAAEVGATAANNWAF